MPRPIQQMPEDQKVLRWVLLPGMDGSGELFQPFLAVLPKEVKPLVISYPTNEKLSYEQLEELVYMRLPDEPFILIAESFSGPIAVRIAERAPPNLRALILCATFVQFPAGTVARLLAMMFGRFIFHFRPPNWIASRYLFGDASPDLKALFLKAISKCSANVMSHRLKSIIDVDARRSLSRIKLPVLLLTGAQDRIVTTSPSESMKQLNPIILVARIDAPHLLLQARPFQALKEIQRLLCHEAPA